MDLTRDVTATFGEDDPNKETLKRAFVFFSRKQIVSDIISHSVGRKKNTGLLFPFIIKGGRGKDLKNKRGKKGFLISYCPCRS